MLVTKVNVSVLIVFTGGFILNTKWVNREILNTLPGHSNAAYELTLDDLSQIGGGSMTELWQHAGTAQFATSLYQGALDVRSGPISPGHLSDLLFVP